MPKHLLSLPLLGGLSSTQLKHMSQTCQTGNSALTGVKISNYMQTAAGMYIYKYIYIHISTIDCIYSLECSWIHAFELSEILENFLLFLTIPPFPFFSNPKISPLNTRCFPILSSKTPFPNIPSGPRLWVPFGDGSGLIQHSTVQGTSLFPNASILPKTKPPRKNPFTVFFWGDPIGWLESR